MNNNPFQPEYLILHDYGGSPGATPSFNPYHTLVSGGRVNYRDAKNPYGKPAPHAYKLNPKSIGLSWGGKVGGMPSKEEFALIKQEYDAIKKQFPNIKVMSHGEAYQQTRGTGQQASRAGRGMEEASWRKFLQGDVPYEPGTVTPAGPTPMGQRSLTAYAGVSKTQPPTTGEPQPMPTYKDVGGRQFMGPDAAQSSRKLGDMLISDGMNSGPMRHWTEALGSVLQTGVGAVHRDRATKDITEGTSAGNDALAQLLMGGDASAAMANPYSSEKAIAYQTQQNDPLYKLKLEKAQADLQNPSSDKPSSVREWEHFLTLNDKDQQRYIQMKRSIPFLNQGTQFVQPNLVNPNAGPAQTLPIDVAGKAAQGAIGKGQGAATVAYPMVKQSGDRLIEAIDRAIQDPALPSVTGFVGGRIPESMQTEKMAAAQANLDQIQGATFLQAYNDLRGGGPIAVAESTNARAAYNTLQNQKQGTNAYKQALTRFREEVIKLQQIAEQRQYQGGGNTLPGIDVPQGGGAEIPTLTDPNQARSLPSGTRFKTPDGRMMEVP